MVRGISITIIHALCTVLTFAQSTSNQVNNSDIARMLKAGVDQKVVRWVIDNSDGKTLDASSSAIQTLKAVGASRAILDAVSAKVAKAKKTSASAAMPGNRPARPTKAIHVTADLRNPATSARASSQVDSLQPETCEDNLQTVDDCHGDHRTGCSSSANPRYDAYLNFLKNVLLDPASTASSDVNGGNPLGTDFFASLEGGIPDTLTSTNHAQHATELAQLGEGQIVTVIGTLFYTIHGGKETCNCELTGDDSLIDFHIGVGFADFPLGADVLSQLQGGSDYRQILSVQDQHTLDQNSVVVEMTPFYREQSKPAWTLSKVQSVTGKKVKVTGQLMTDNDHHKPNDDCSIDGANTNKCWRLSVWEVHPVLRFQVCGADHCDANSTKWVNLEEM